MSALSQLPRSQRKRIEAALKVANSKWPKALVDVDRDKWPAMPNAVKQMPFRVMRSSRFIVQFYQPYESIVRLSVTRTQMAAGGQWEENISWDDLQQIKAESGYSDKDAVEVYPPDRDVVKEANMRHLWVFLDVTLPFAWRAGHPRS